MWGNWIKKTTDECPINPFIEIQIQVNCGSFSEGQAGAFYWGNIGNNAYNIKRFRILYKTHLVFED